MRVRWSEGCIHHSRRVNRLTCDHTRWERRSQAFASIWWLANLGDSVPFVFVVSIETGPGWPMGIILAAEAIHLETDTASKHENTLHLPQGARHSHLAPCCVLCFSCKRQLHFESRLSHGYTGTDAVIEHDGHDVTTTGGNVNTPGNSGDSHPSGLPGRAFQH